MDCGMLCIDMHSGDIKGMIYILKRIITNSIWEQKVYVQYLICTMQADLICLF